MRKLLFVYNAKSGALNLFFDIGHKLLSPKTYSCSLCAITHDTFNENNTWKAFRANSPADMSFFHRDEFESQYPGYNFKYPSILIEDRNGVHELIPKEEIDMMNSVTVLINSINSKVMV